MEDKANPPEKSTSFNSKQKDAAASSPKVQPPATADSKSDTGDASHDDSNTEPVDAIEKNEEVKNDSAQDLTLPQLSEEIDEFLASLSADSTSPEIPNFIESFVAMVKSLMARYDSGEVKFGWGDDDSSLIEAIGRISNLVNAFRELSPSPDSQMASSLNRTSSVLQSAMQLLEEEFRTLLEDSGRDSKISSVSSLDSKENSVKSKSAAKQGSFNSGKEDSSSSNDRCALSDPAAPPGEEEFPSFSPESVSAMNKIAAAMISAGYETECCQVYSVARRHAVKDALTKLGLERISIDDVQRMQWEVLVDEIGTWIKVVKHCTTLVFPGEKKFCQSVFSGNAAVSRSLFSNLARALVIQLLNFAEAVAMIKRGDDKLFRTLDMFETLRELGPAIDDFELEECVHELKSEMAAAGSRLGEAVVGNFCSLENNIKSNTGKTAVPGGALHPLTRYTMNYLTYACEYKDSLEQVFRQHHQKVGGPDQDSAESELDQSDSQGQADHSNNNHNHNYSNEHKSSPFSAQLAKVMDLLDLYLEANSKLYKDSSLRYIFLMNNGRYILQKIKGSAEIHELMGDTWCRKRSSDLRQYHKNYQRDTWVRVLGCLKDEGLHVHGKVSKPNLKERFKSFNAVFDDIHRTQSTWVVSDEQLQSELRVSISALVIPAYRSFLGRFQQYLDPGRQTEKYIKLQPEDIETAIEDLFDGNPTSMARRKA